MWVMIAGLVMFFGVHSVRMIAGPFRDAQLSTNEGRWKGLYSLASLLGFALIILGWWVYRAVAPEVFTSPSWGHPVTLLLVFLAFISLVSAYTPAGYIRRTVQHPFLTGVALWALGHLLVNGDLASLLVFGAFLLYAVVDRVAVIFRPPPAMGAPSIRGDIVAVVVGFLLYAAFGLWVHPWLFGPVPFL
jgi:uncharacterized membrane protein